MRGRLNHEVHEKHEVGGHKILRALRVLRGKLFFRCTERGVVRRIVAPTIFGQLQSASERLSSAETPRAEMRPRNNVVHPSPRKYFT